MNHPLPLTDEEMLIMAKWLEKTATVNGKTVLHKRTALRLAHTLWWVLSKKQVELIGEPAP